MLLINPGSSQRHRADASRAARAFSTASGWRLQVFAIVRSTTVPTLLGLAIVMALGACLGETKSNSNATQDGAAGSPAVDASADDGDADALVVPIDHDSPSCKGKQCGDLCDPCDPPSDYWCNGPEPHSQQCNSAGLCVFISQTMEPVACGDQ
jgi:hypothetical protein